MKVDFWVVGKTNEEYLRTGIDLYCKRLQHYLSFSMTVFPDLKKAKNYAPAQFKKLEGEAVLAKINPSDVLILLDEKGRQFDSLAFAKQLDRLLMSGGKRLIFLVGGAYGFSEQVYKRANHKLSLSAMTFSHQMIRLFFVEQLYRGMTILKGEPYHNQ